jgi:hypothetical protein
MICREYTAEDLKQYHSGKANGTHSEIKAHVGICDGCRDFLRQLSYPRRRLKNAVLKKIDPKRRPVFDRTRRPYSPFRERGNKIILMNGIVRRDNFLRR